MFKPLSENIIFFDTEFSDLDPYKGELLSIGMIKPNGEELYVELRHDGDVSDWVKDNVLPMLTEIKISREEAKKAIRGFLGESMPYLFGFINQYDDVYMSKLFLNDGKPYNYMPLDLATLLFFYGINPLAELKQGIDPSSEVEKMLGLDLSHYRNHHALDDAKWVRDVYSNLLDRS